MVIVGARLLNTLNGVVIVITLFLQETVNLEPVGPAAVARAALGHAHHQTLPQATRLARGAVLLVDDALTAVLTLGDARQVVVGATEERLQARQHERKLD